MKKKNWIGGGGNGHRVCCSGDPSHQELEVPYPTQKINLILQDSGKSKEVVPRILITKY